MKSLFLCVKTRAKGLFSCIDAEGSFSLKIENRKQNQNSGLQTYAHGMELAGIRGSQIRENRMAGCSALAEPAHTVFQLRASTSFPQCLSTRCLRI